MAEFDYGVVKDPTIFQQNRLDAHSDHEFYDSEGQFIDMKDETDSNI